jgi:hypothetical protein
VARYSNCWQGRSEANVHAERFLLHDERLRKAIAALPDSGGTLVLYLTYQPCHHSGGHRRRGMGEHGTSCTTLLLDYLREELSPRNVRMEVRIAYLYRAHWSAGAYDPKYEPAVMAARSGLHLLKKNGVVLSALSTADLDWLATQCSPSVHAAWRDGEPPFGRAVREARARLDAFVAAFLETEIQGEDRADKVASAAAAATGPEGEGNMCEPCEPDVHVDIHDAG